MDLRRVEVAHRLEQMALAVARPGRRAPKAWDKQVQLRERIADALRPMMAGVDQWLVRPKAGESEVAYARRAARYAAMRLGHIPDPAVIASVVTLVRRTP